MAAFVTGAAWSAERDPSKPYLETVYDDDLGAIAQVTHPDGTVVTDAEAVWGAAVWGSVSVVVAVDGSLSGLQCPEAPTMTDEKMTADDATAAATAHSLMFRDHLVTSMCCVNPVCGVEHAVSYRCQSCPDLNIEVVGAVSTTEETE